MENDAALLPSQPASPRMVEGGIDREANPDMERAIALGKEVIGITGTVIVAGISGYKDIANDVTALCKLGGFCLLVTFICAVVLTNLQISLLPSGARHGRCPDALRAVLVILTCAMLMFTKTIFIAVMSKGYTLLAVLMIPVILTISMLAGCEAPAEAGQSSAAIDEAYEAAMKGGSELATFGATAAFTIEGAVIFGYLKNPSFGGCHPQVVLAVSFFASTVCVFAMAVTALPVRPLFPGAMARLVEMVRLLRRVIFAALILMAVILAVEFLQLWFMLSLVPELIAGALNIVIMLWHEDAGPTPAEARPDGEVLRERVVATMSFTLMAATHAVYLGQHEKYDVSLRACMLVMLAAVMPSLRRIIWPCNLPRSGGWVIGAVRVISMVFPGLSLVIAIPLAVKIIIHFYSGQR